jgi:hypothetical protein
MKAHITEYLLYRKRHLLGYSVIALAIVGLLIVAGLFIPGGLSQAETQSVVTSSALSIDTFDASAVVDLPYHVLQRISIDTLGVTNLSIKLPSLLIGALSVFGMIVLLRMWFRHNVAITATILIVTTGQFLFFAQSGTPNILYIFWTTWLLVAALKVSRSTRFITLWKIALFGIAALSLYTPLSIYILVALASAMILHPRLRFIIRKLSKWKLALAIASSFVLLAPLIYTIIRQPSVAMTLLGIPERWPDIWSNILQLLRQHLDFISQSSGELMLPVYGLGSVILIGLGVLHLFTTKYTARSYIIISWVTLLIPVLAVNPSFMSATFVPALLLMAMGIHTLLRNWYQLFPRNPYARVAGLIPLAVLISGMVLSGVNRYTYGYLYDPNTASHFSKDLRIMNRIFAQPDRGNTTLIVTKQEANFYIVVAKHQKNVSVNPPQTTPSDTIIVSHDAFAASDQQEPPSAILTDGSARNADRFYVY